MASNSLRIFKARQNSSRRAATRKTTYSPTRCPPLPTPQQRDTCTAVLYDGVVVRVYDFDNIQGFTNMRYVQGTPEGFEWESPQNKDTHLGFYSSTQAVYVTSQNVKLYNFNKLNGFSYVSETTQNTTCASCPTISEVGDDALDNVFDFLDSNRAVEFNGQNVILYDWDSQLLTNAQIIQGIPTGFATGAGATGNHLAFANPSQAVYFDGSDVQLYDFDITNGFTNPQTIQGTPSEFSNRRRRHRKCFVDSSRLRPAAAAPVHRR